MKNLRKKLNSPEQESAIKSIRGFGYLIEKEEK
jgi:DNA-binding response OmpR family regulator